MRKFLVLLLAPAAITAFAQRVAVPPTECEAPVGYDRDRVLAGYILPTSAGAKTCIPFTTVAAHPPPGYVGDFYVDEFSDERLRSRYAKCKLDKECAEPVMKAVMARQPPHVEYSMKDERRRYLLGRPPEGDDIDLKSIRRPAFFAQAPYNEPIAEADARTSVVEFTAPRDAYERNIRKMTGSVKLRGWYLRGDGVDDGKGGRSRALVIMTGGGGTRVAAITDPAEPLYYVDDKGHHRTKPFPTETSGQSGQHHWRMTATLFNRAGFDVLMLDRRGVGLSTGYSDTNTLQQGRDLLAVVAALRSGEGVRALTPAGETVMGSNAVQALRGTKQAQGLPVLLLGNSRGTMASGWAMTMNFHRNCTYDLPEVTCQPPVGDKSIKGAIVFAEFTSGPGYNPDRQGVEDQGRTGPDRLLWIAGNAVELNIVFYPTSAILAGMEKWPALFFARGLWDYAGALEGTADSFSRVKGPKELVVVRGPHPMEVWPATERRRAQERAINFAVTVIQGKSRVEGARPWTNLKELVATTSDVWEESTRPVQAVATQERIRIMGPSEPAAGFATTARAVQEAMTAAGIADVDPYFVPGDGGLTGLKQFVKDARGDGRHLMITGYTTIGSILSNRSAVTLDDVTPIACLIKLYPFGLLVSAKSPITNAGQLAAMLKADPSKVSWVAGSVGGAGHTTVVRFAMLNHVDPAKLNFNTSFGEDTLAAVIDGKATVAVSSGFAGYDKEVKAGRLRLIGTTGAQRRPDIDAPTLKEQGFDLVFENWRGVVAPPGITSEQRQALAATIERMVKSPAWKEILKKRNWDDAYLGSAAFETFLKSERVKVEEAFRAAGMLK